MKRNHLAIIWCHLLFVSILLCASVGIAADSLSIPHLEGRVTDKANLLTKSERKHISDLLADYEKDTTHQLAVLIVSALNGESIESFSLRVARCWGLGLKDIDNGVLVTLAMKERKVRIELGSGMEKYISNSTAKSIIESSMVPAFKESNFSGGIENGLLQIMGEARNFVVSARLR